MQIRSTSDNSNLLGKSKKVRVIGSLKQITGDKLSGTFNLSRLIDKFGTPEYKVQVKPTPSLFSIYMGKPVMQFTV